MSRFFKPKKAKPREKQALLMQYTQLCSYIGDKQVKARLLKREIDALHIQVEALSKEMDLVLEEEKKTPPVAPDVEALSESKG